MTMTMTLNSQYTTDFYFVVVVAGDGGQQHTICCSHGLKSEKETITRVTTRQSARTATKWQGRTTKQNKATTKKQGASLVCECTALLFRTTTAQGRAWLVVVVLFPSLWAVLS